MSTIHISMCSPVLIRLYTHVFTYVCMYVHMCTLFNTCSLARLNTEHLYVYMFTVHMFPCGTPFSYPNPCSKHKGGIGGIHSHMFYLSIYVHMSRIHTYIRSLYTCSYDRCIPVMLSHKHLHTVMRVHRPYKHVYIWSLHTCFYIQCSPILPCTQTSAYVHAWLCVRACSYIH